MSAQLKENPFRTEAEDSAQPQEAASVKQRPVYIKEAVSSIQGFKNFVRYKFSADQIYGTLFLMIVAYSNFQGLKAAWERQGIKKGENAADLSATVNKKNWQDIISACMTLSTNLWSFLSSRSAIPPDGNSYKERLIDTIKHPERSHEQFKYLFFLFKFFIIEWGYIKYGFTDAGMKEEKFSKRLQAASLPVSSTLTFTDMFEDKQARKEARKDKQAEVSTHLPAFQNSKSQTLQGKWFYPLRVIRETWRENPKRIISILLNMATSAMLLQEGLSKHRAMTRRLQDATHIGSDSWFKMKDLLEKDQGHMSDKVVLSSIQEMRDGKMLESRSLIKKGGISLIMSIANAFYSLDQLYKGEEVKSAQGSAEKHTFYRIAEQERTKSLAR